MKATEEQHKLFKELLQNHNDLITRHNNLVDDAEAILSFISNIGIGLGKFATEVDASDEELVDAIERFCQLQSGEELPDVRAFALDMYNEIGKFVGNINDNKRPIEAYDMFLESCREAARREGGVYNGE